ncbi:MAG: DUF559 domain-containing protein [Chloroflexi bacterium]|nr:DUF559 domain-containing protein [Chloroflexota bacterium]
MKRNWKQIGDERERTFLGYIRLSRRDPGQPDVRDPDSHLDLPCGQLEVGGLAFDFAWWDEEVLLELDGGQRVRGGGRHNSDTDRWKTLEAQALGWRVLHVSYTMLKADPARVMRVLAEVLND